MKRLDLVGQKFERLTVMAFSCMKRNNSYWSCECECGGKTEVSIGNLRNGHTKSCGCYKKEQSSKSHTVHGYSKRGLKGSTYIIWQAMIQRCTNPNSKSYKYWGGRGIKVCDRWRHSYVNFLADMGERPEGLSLDRVDNNGDYEPSNCKWSTLKEQVENRRNNRNIEYNGETKTLSQWAEYLGINYSTLNARLSEDTLNWSIERAFTEPVIPKKQVEYKGETHTVSQWAEILGIPRYILYYRLNHPSWDIEKSLTTPIK